MASYDDYDDEGAGPLARIAGAVLLVGVLGIVGWVLLSGSGGDGPDQIASQFSGVPTIVPDDAVGAEPDDADAPDPAPTTAATAPTTETLGDQDPVDAASDGDENLADADTPSDVDADTDPAADTDTPPDTDPAADTDTPPDDGTDPDPATDGVPADGAPGDEAPGPDTDPSGSTAPPAAGSESDAAPAPGEDDLAIAIFDRDTIALIGAVPSAEASDHLANLARLNSKVPDAVVQNDLTIDPAVPLSVGVRVIELDSVRFPEGSSAIAPEHAAELDRVVGVLQGFPDVEVLVIGHSDQRGDAGRNYILSAARAQAVVDYMVSQGIAAERLTSRAVGESDLLTLDDDDESLALNRRTEFVFYGLLETIPE